MYLALSGHVVVGGVPGDLVLHPLGRGVRPVVPRVLHSVAHACLSCDYGNGGECDGGKKSKEKRICAFGVMRR